MGQLPYAGIGGVIPLLDSYRYLGRDGSRSLIDNIIAGDWLLKYTWGRLLGTEELLSLSSQYFLSRISKWLEEVRCR